MILLCWHRKCYRRHSLSLQQEWLQQLLDPDNKIWEMPQRQSYTLPLNCVKGFHWKKKLRQNAHIDATYSKAIPCISPVFARLRSTDEVFVIRMTVLLVTTGGRMVLHAQRVPMGTTCRDQSRGLGVAWTWSSEVYAHLKTGACSRAVSVMFMMIKKCIET